MRSSSKWKITIEEGTGQKNIQKSQGLNIVQMALINVAINLI